MFCKKSVLRNFAKLTGKHLCQNLFLSKVADLIKKETLTQVFERSLRTPQFLRVAASVKTTHR